MDAQKFEILDEEIKANLICHPSILPPPEKTALRGFFKPEVLNVDLFGQNSESRKCLNCGKPLPSNYPNKKHCDYFCRNEYRHKRDIQIKTETMTTRERHALEWIKENPQVIQYIVNSALRDKLTPSMKSSIRRYWEQARAVFPEITFDNNHTRFVSRYIMEQYPDLAGVFRTRS